MKTGLTITRSFHKRNGRRGKKILRHGKAKVASSGRIPRVARLMALAIRYDHLFQEGVVADQAELARLGHVSRARLTQIMNLRNLAPDIQDEIVHLPQVERGRDPVTERVVRPIAAEPDWAKQRRMWRSTQLLMESNNLSLG